MARLTTMRCSHGPNGRRRSKRSSARTAARKASCATSSAAVASWTTSHAARWARGQWRRKSSAKASAEPRCAARTSAGSDARDQRPARGAGAQRLQGDRLHAHDRRTHHAPVTSAEAREVPAIIRAVQPEFLPPDPHADRAAGSAARVAPGLPAAQRGAAGAGQAQNNRAVASLIFGSGSLGLLFFSAGVLFFLTLPGSIVAWVLGNRAKRADTARDQANVAVIIAIVGVVLGVIAAVVWIVLVATGEYSTTTEVDHGSDGGLHFDVIRLVLPGS